MTVQNSVTLRNARLDSDESAIGPSPILKIRTGAQPADCAAADSGTVLATLTLPSDWMNPASNGTKTKLGTWADSSCDADGTAGHYRIYDSTGTVCHEQGSITATGAGGDMTVDNVVFAIGQSFTITAYTKTAGNQ
jgi:hypothetical protein